MHRVDTTDSDDKWRFACPAPARHRSWRVVDGRFECRACNQTYAELVDTKTGERVPRDQLEVVGPHADSKGAFGQPTVGEDS